MKLKELIKGEIYIAPFGAIEDYIFMATKDSKSCHYICNRHSTYSPGGVFNYETNPSFKEGKYREATYNEKRQLLASIKEREFVPLKDIPEEQYNIY